MYLPGSTYDSIERDVHELLEDWGFSDFPLSMELICQRMHIQLRSYSSLSEEAREVASSISADSFHIGGDYSRISEITIFYNDEKSIARRRYNIAHEIGHIIRELPEDTEEAEKESDYFAGYLLAPDPLVAIHCPTLDAYEISGVFEISMDAADVARRHTSTRMACGKAWKDYEYGIIKLSSVKGVRTLDTLNENSH